MICRPNNRVEPNRCQASRLRSWLVIGDGFWVCDGAPSAAVAHPRRSAASSVMRVFLHTQLRGSRVADETDAVRWSHGPQLAQFRTPLIKSARCVGEVGACHQVRSHHGSRPFESGLAMVAHPRLRTVMISCPIQPPNHRVETNRCQASRLRSRRAIGDTFPVWDGALTAAVAHPTRWADI